MQQRLDGLSFNRLFPGLVWCGLFGAAALLPFSTAGNAGNLQLGVDIELYCILALGLNVVVGFAGLLDLGYIAFYGVGAYLYAFFASPWFGIHLSLMEVIPIGAVCASIFGVAFGYPTLRLRGDYLAVVTLGFGEIVQLVMNNAVSLTNGSNGIFDLDVARVAGIQLTSVQGYYWFLMAAVAFTALFTKALQMSRLGRAWRAMRSDEDAAKGAGINTVLMKLLAFLIGAMVAGGAGVIFSAEQAFVSPQSFTIDGSILVLAMVLLGGSGRVSGAIVGAVVSGLIVEGLNGIGALRYVLIGVLMVVVMIMRPRGMIGEKSSSGGRGRSRGYRARLLRKLGQADVAQSAETAAKEHGGV